MLSLYKIFHMHKFTNALIHAGSPYLQQHAHNPVNWVEWSDEALEQAKREDKLILVSIGYSSCHWCHVMEHECFEKEDTAAIMNEHFICIKVDREERPDIDQIYMDAVQLLSGRGGWPLNMFTLPDGRPLHGGTYFPKGEWERILLSLSAFYRDKKLEAYEFATNLSNGIKNLDHFAKPNGTPPLYPILMGLLDKWKNQFDLTWGAYNWAPKFPLPNQWELFMGIHHLSGQTVFGQASYTTLVKMFEGGIFDHLGGGFSRYSTDSFWKVPHFEKMLYDNAQLMGTYAMAAAYYEEPLFEKVCEETHKFLKRDLQDPSGSWYSALDADSEGVEGKYYVWTEEEIRGLLPAADADLFCAFFSIEPLRNWEHGINILYRTQSIEKLVAAFSLSENQIENSIERCKGILLQTRMKRVPPGLDNKMICSWNALMVKGYAKAFLYLGKDMYLQEAINGMEHLLSWHETENKLYRIHMNGKSGIEAFAEDYACMMDALITLYEASSEEKYLQRAKGYLEYTLTHFYDSQSGLFYFASDTEKVLITRKLEINDDVIPASNSILAHCLNKLSYYFERTDWEEISLNMVQTIREKMEKFPNGFSNWMQLIANLEFGFKQVMVAGPNAQEWATELRKEFSYNTAILLAKEGNNIPLLQEKAKHNQQTQVWICRHKTCGLPLTDLEQARLEIRK